MLFLLSAHSLGVAVVARYSVLLCSEFMSQLAQCLQCSCDALVSSELHASGRDGTPRITTAALCRCWASALDYGAAHVQRCKASGDRGKHRLARSGIGSGSGRDSRSSPLASTAPTGESILGVLGNELLEGTRACYIVSEINQEVGGSEELTLEWNGIAHRR